MAIREGLWQSKNDHDFILRSLRNGQRIDGRQLGDMRLLRMVLGRSEGQASAEIQLGRTRVLGVVTGEVVPPFPDRPTEGFLHFNVELGPMAAASMGELRNSPLSVEIARVIEIGVRDSQALDTEALCIIGGEKVWQLRCDVHILDHGGNLIDACTLATMAALRHFRRPEVTIDGSKVVVHHTDDKEPQPLALHHVPICVTCAIFEDTEELSLAQPGSSGGQGGQGDGGMSGAGAKASATQHTAVDPTEAEEEVMKGRITFALTAHKELCALHKNGGVAVTRETILRCARLASVKVEEIHKVLEKALAGADAKAALDRQSRLRGTNPGIASTTGPRPVLGQAPGTVPGMIPLPGTRSTPFVVTQAPMPVAPESLKVKHLDYDDLHVTQGVREEGLRGGGNRGGRGLDMDDARNTDLFAKMAKAAGMTQARLAGDDQSAAAAPPPASRPSPGATTTPPSMSKNHRNRNEGTTGGAGSSPAGLLAGFPAGGGEGRGGEGGDGDDAAKSEFARLAQALRKEETGVGGGAGGAGERGGGGGARAGVDAAKTAMDVDSDEEEATVTLHGEFQADAGKGEGSVIGGEDSEKKGGGCGERAAGGGGGGDDEDEDDLVSAVKKGKGKGRGKGSKSKGKRGKT